MRPRPGEVLHFSEDPTITRFVPQVAPTAKQRQPYVWAVDHGRSPDYWFPRECPRALAWVTEGTTAWDRQHILGPGGGERIHAIEYAWFERFHTVALFAYRLPAASFRAIGEPVAHAMVSTEPLDPLSPPERVGSLLDLHAAAGIQLRLLNRLQEFWNAVIDSSLGFSGIRLHNAQPAQSVRF